MTNFERIKAMTDQELAEWVASDFYNPHCPESNGVCNVGCAECWLNWLRKENEGDI